MSVEQLTRISFRVHGIPATQGSLRAIMPRDKKTGRPLTTHPIMTHDNAPGFRGWRDAVATEALRARPSDHVLEGPVRLVLCFYLPTPKARPTVIKTSKQQMKWKYPWRRPDVDRLQRAVLDALRGVLYHDDAQIVRIAVSKEYSTDPGLEVVVEQLV